MAAVTSLGTRAGKPLEARSSEIDGEGGFSLVELVVTIGIIGVLAVLAIATYLTYRNKAQTVEARLGLHNIWVLENSFEKENSRYTADLTELGFRMHGNTRYVYTVQADTRSFTARAEANLDNDPALDVWEIYYTTIEPVHLETD